jgi:large repetitive protein
MIAGQRRRVGPQTPGLTAGEVAVFDLPLDTASRFATSGTVSLAGAARLVAIGADGRVTLNAWPAAKETALPKRARAFAILAGAEAGAGEMAGWLGASQVIYLGQALARCRGGFLRAEGASRSRGGRLAGTGWTEAADLSNQSALVETRFDGPADSLAIVLEGTVTEADLALMALSIRGAKVADTQPLLVPYDGKTLIVHALAGAEEKGMLVRVGGVTAGRLDGVIAARMPPDRLVARFLGETLDLDLEVQASGDAGEVRATWRAPSAPEPVE